MSADNRFKPPAAVVDDVGVTASRAPLLVLATVALTQFLWFAFQVGSFVELVSANALPPIGLLLAVAGEACLFVATVRATWRQGRPQKTFFAAVVLFAACMGVWRSLTPHFFGVFVLGMVAAAMGWKVVRERAAASSTGG